MMNAKKPSVIVLYNYYTTWSPEERGMADRQTQELVGELTALGHTVRTVEFWKDVRRALRDFDPNKWIIFNWVEGIEDEVGGDARICEDLQSLGFTFTGNPPDTLRLSVQKGKVKKVLDRWHIPTPAGREFASGDEVKTWSAWPAIVKPVSQHCSAGVTREAVVHDLDSLRARVQHVREVYKESSLVEQFIAGREINVGIWGNGRPRLLPLREIDFSQMPNPLHQMVTWDSKWVPTSEDWNKMPVMTDVQVSDTLRAKLEEITIKTYRVFGCRDYARIDYRIDKDENAYVVDVNPNPDITSDGGFIGGCRMLGYSYGEAVSNIISMAVTRRNRRNALMNTLQQRRVVESSPRVKARQLALA